MRDEDFCCAICLDYFVEPVIMECGHSYCRFCIESHLKITEKCPLCLESTSNLIRNRQLESLTMSYVSSQKQGDDYYERMKANKKALLLQNRASVIVELAKRAGNKAEELCNLVKRVTDEELKSEIMRQSRESSGDTEGKRRRSH